MGKRTIYTPNNIIVYDDYAVIELYNRYGDVIGYGKIDIEDIDLVKQYKWSLGRGRAAYLTAKTGTIYLHRLLLGVEDTNVHVDHINGDKTDNRRCNLRLCTNAQNHRNISKQSNNTTGHKNIYMRDGAWTVQFKSDGKYYSKKFTWSKHGGKEQALQKAIEWRDKKVHEINGEFSNTK